MKVRRIGHLRYAQCDGESDGGPKAGIASGDVGFLGNRVVPLQRWLARLGQFLRVQYYHREDQSSRVTRETFTPSGLSPVGPTVTTRDRFLFENTTVGAYVQQEFDWENRIFLTGALRRDDNSVLWNGVR